MDEYNSGYGKPPKHSQFKPGQSGNPKGRPAGSRNRITMLQEELAQIIEIKEGDKTRRITKLEAAVKAATIKAMKGDPRPLIHLIELLEKLFGGPIAELIQTTYKFTLKLEDDDPDDEPVPA